jgi:hypothetical protein
VEITNAKETAMCLQCGCKRPYDKMGDENNLTVDDIKKSVQTENAKGKTTEEAVQELLATWKEKVKDKDKDFKAEAA